jgi:hypothetical protein
MGMGGRGGGRGVVMIDGGLGWCLSADMMDLSHVFVVERRLDTSVDRHESMVPLEDIA